MKAHIVKGKAGLPKEQGEEAEQEVTPWSLSLMICRRYEKISAIIQMSTLSLGCSSAGIMDLVTWSQRVRKPSSWDHFPGKGVLIRQTEKEHKSSACGGGDSCQAWRKGIPSRKMLCVRQVVHHEDKYPVCSGISHARSDLFWPKQYTVTNRWSPMYIIHVADLCVPPHWQELPGKTKRHQWWIKWLTNSGNMKISLPPYELVSWL